MKIEAQANTKQLDDVDVTINVTMKMSEWKYLMDDMRRSNKESYWYGKEELANSIAMVVRELSDRQEKIIEYQAYRMIRLIKNWLNKTFKPELCAECGRKLIIKGVPNTIYPMQNNNKIESVHRACLYQYLFKHTNRENCDRIYKALTK
jgi:hypothetical protein